MSKYLAATLTSVFLLSAGSASAQFVPSEDSLQGLYAGKAY